MKIQGLLYFLFVVSVSCASTPQPSEQEGVTQETLKEPPWNVSTQTAKPRRPTHSGKPSAKKTEIGPVTCDPMDEDFGSCPKK